MGEKSKKQSESGGKQKGGQRLAEAVIFTWLASRTDGMVPGQYGFVESAMNALRF
jgi:hypothetical protein